MMPFPRRYADFVQRLRVPAGFVLVAAFAWLSEPTPETLAIGVPVSLAGLVLRAWAAGHLAKNETLATGGPYAWVRNPLYPGTLTVAAGLVIASRRWELAVLFGAVFALVYFPVIEQEEQHLRKLFPEFRHYSARVPLLLPRGRRMRSSVRFRTSLYIRNEEYNAALGYLAGLAWLLWRAFQRLS
jgi:protein-S-isoprenylcysteine O-methyltransferase Ste14